MAVTAADLLDPVGRIRPDFFPGEEPADLTDRIDGWIALAIADAGIAALDDPDPAVTAYVYARAFGAIADRLNAEAARTTFSEQGTREMLKEQLAYWAGERDREENRLAALVAAGVEPEGAITDAPLPSSYSAIGFVF